MYNLPNSISVAGIFSKESMVRPEALEPSYYRRESASGQQLSSDAELIDSACLCCRGFTFTLCPVTVSPVTGCQNLNCSRRMAP